MSFLLAPPPTPDAGYSHERAPFLWLLEREIVRFLRIWHFSTLGPILSTLLFVFVFGHVLNKHIDSVHGIPYAHFIIPGLVVQALVNVSFYNGTTSLFEGRNDRYIHDVLSSPIKLWEINAALVLAAVIRGIITGIGVLIVAVPLTGVRAERPIYLVFAALGVLLVAAQFGVISGTLSNSLDVIYAMESLVLLPLGFLGGIFYSVNELPGPWNTVSQINPFYWVIQVAQIGTHGRGDVPGWLALAVVWTTGIALTFWSIHLFSRSSQIKP